MSSLLNKINLEWVNFSKSESVIAIGVSPSYTYENGHRTDSVEGYIVEVVFPDLAFEKMRIKVATKPKFTQADIEASSKPFMVKFEDFSARFYIIDGYERLSAKAKKCIAVDGNANDFADYEMPN